MPQQTPQVPTSAINPQRPANALVLAPLGGMALVLFFWCAWCLGWLSVNAAFNIIVIAPLTLIAGYASQLVRFHKQLKLPPLTVKGRIKAWLFWGITALFILQVIWKQKGFVAGLLGVTVLVEAMCAFIHFLSARFERKAALLSLLQSALHATGWLFYLGMAVYGIDRYAGVLEDSVNLLAGFPPPLQSAFRWCAEAPGIFVTCITALMLVGASLLLRVYLYANQGKFPVKVILNPLGKIAIGAFLLANTFGVFAVTKLHHQWMETVAVWTNSLTNTTESPSEGAEKFAAKQKSLGETLVALAHQETDEDAPYAWGKFCRQTDDQRLAPWYPPEMGPDPEDQEALQKYLDQLAPSLKQLDDLLEGMDIVPDAQIAGGTYLLAEWRFHVYAELRQWDNALRALKTLAAIARYQAESIDMTQRVRGIHRIVLWTENQKKFPGDIHQDALRAQGQELRHFLEELPHKEAIDAFVQETHEKLLAVRSDFRNWGIPMPFFYMVTTADDIRLMTAFQNIQTPAQVAPTPKGHPEAFLYCAFVQNSIARVYHYEWNTALGRLEQL